MISNLKIYLAGRIESDDWRHSILYVPKLHRELNCDESWKIAYRAIFDKYHYTGCYYESADHSTYDHVGDGLDDSHRYIASQCKIAISKSDLIFAYIRSAECYGTLVELGYANALNKKIVLCINYDIDGTFKVPWFVNNETGEMIYKQDDLWFVQQFADKVILSDNPKQALYDYLEPNLKTMPYGDYLQTEHWKDTRTRKLIEAGYKCQVCNSNGKLNVHHRTYENRGNEQLDDLLVLCNDCHKLFHENGKLSYAK